MSIKYLESYRKHCEDTGEEGTIKGLNDYYAEQKKNLDKKRDGLSHQNINKNSN